MDTDARGNATLAAIAALFFVNGASLASWTPRLPEVQASLGVSEGVLGLILVGMGLGGLTVSLLSGKVVDRFGSKRVSVVTSITMSALLPLLGVATQPFVLFAVLMTLGLFDGLTDVAMNTQAVVLESRRSGHIMSRLHGMWSVGAVVGGVVSSRAAAADVSIRTQLLVTSAVMIATTLTIRRWLIPDRVRGGQPTIVATPLGDAVAGPRQPDDEPRPPGRRFRRPNALLTRLFLVGTAVALAEAPPNEWASLMWVDHYGLAEGRAALGYVSIATGMVVGRFSGDFIVARAGAERTRRSGAAVAALGVGVATLAPVAWLSGVGLFATGAGVSLLFPLMFAAASALARSAGMAAFSSGARFGFLVAPPLVGAMAGLTSVATAILVVAGTGAITVAVTPLHPRDSTTPC